MLKTILFLFALTVVGGMLFMVFNSIRQDSKSGVVYIFKNPNFYLLVIIFLFWLYGVFTVIQDLVAYFLRVS